MRLIWLLLAGLCAACGGGGDNQPADTIIINGKIFTGGAESGDVQALAIRDGRILAVGSEEEIRARAGEKTDVIDAEGRRVIPGLTDAHAHFSARPKGVWLDTGEGPTPDPTPRAVLDAVTAEAANPGSKGWIYGVIGPAVLEDPSLRRAALDNASPARPVMLVAFTGHGTILNTRGMKMLAVDEDNDPPGGWCVRDGVGVCTGLIREMSEFAARRRLHMSAPIDRTAEAYRQAADTYLRWGVTAVHEMALSHTVERTTAALEEAGIRLRWAIYRAPMLRGSLDEAWSARDDGGERPGSVRVAGIKWIMDGTPIERDAAMRFDYPGRKGWQGRLNFTPEEIHRILSEGLQRKEQLALHISGDRTLETVFAAMREIAPPEKWREHRMRIEHGDGLSADLFDQAKELGIVLVQNPLHFAEVPMFTNRLSKERRKAFQAIRSALENGIPLALGADASGPASNPYLNLMMAARHPGSPDEALSVRQALSAYSRGGAVAAKMEEERGTLEPGKLADLAVLSQDVLEIPPEDLPATRSILTMIGGEIIYREDESSHQAAKN